METRRHEEELVLGRSVEEAGRLGIRKAVETHGVHEDVPKDSERATVERAPASEGDSGQVEELPDGSISIPVFEEELVVRKRTVVRERLIVRKEVVTEHERIDAELRRERVEIEATGDVELEQ